MPIRFTVLASGSAGNASLIQADDFGLLLDFGLGPRQLAARLATVGASWDRVHAVLLTHTHGDHWNDRTLAHLRRRAIPLYCHGGHIEALSMVASEFAALQSASLVRPYDPHADLTLRPGFRCRPLTLSHDGGPCFGFRLEQDAASRFGESSALAYAADLGCWTPTLAQAIADVDLLALEFNHDVQMQHASGRSFHLIRRVLGDHGHLSNVQAALLVQETLRRSPPGRLRHLVQLHLSRECNQPKLAIAAARAALDGHSVEIHTARQDTPGPDLMAHPLPGRDRQPSDSRRNPRPIPSTGSSQPWLPGLEPSA